MKRIHFTLWLTVCIVLVSFMSCDTMSSVDYNIHNITTDTVTVTFHREIMTSPYQGYDIVENDSVTTHYGGDSAMVAVLAPNQYLIVKREWSGLYREELVVPAWRYIAAIRVGDTELDSEQWTTESLWHIRSNAGRFNKNETRHYDLWIRSY